MTLWQLLGFSSLVFSGSVCSGQQTSSVQDLSDLSVVVRSNNCSIRSSSCNSCGSNSILVAVIVVVVAAAAVVVVVAVVVEVVVVVLVGSNGRSEYDYLMI